MAKTLEIAQLRGYEVEYNTNLSASNFLFYDYLDEVNAQPKLNLRYDGMDGFDIEGIDFGDKDKDPYLHYFEELDSKGCGTCRYIKVYSPLAPGDIITDESEPWSTVNHVSLKYFKKNETEFLSHNQWVWCVNISDID